MFRLSRDKASAQKLLLFLGRALPLLMVPSFLGPKGESHKDQGRETIHKTRVGL